MNHQIVFCTCPDNVTASAIANSLVDKRLAACVNILPGMRSVYRWQDERQSSDEWLLIIKSAAHVFLRLQTAILELHPYELPEIVAVPVTAGLPGYLDWIGRESNGE